MMQKGKQNTAGGSAAGAAPALDHAVIAQEPAKATTPGLFCKELAIKFQVRTGEIALLRLEKGLAQVPVSRTLEDGGSDSGLEFLGGGCAYRHDQESGTIQ